MEDKWQFIPDKECPYCFEDLGYWNIKDIVVSGCPNCHRSFCD